MTILTCVLEKKWLKFIWIVLEKEFSFEKKVLHVKILDRKGIIYFIMKGLCILRGGKMESFDEKLGEKIFGSRIKRKFPAVEIENAFYFAEEQKEEEIALCEEGWRIFLFCKLWEGRLGL
jgi:hypothetical protein